MKWELFVRTDEGDEYTMLVSDLDTAFRQFERETQFEMESVEFATIKFHSD